MKILPMNEITCIDFLMNEITMNILPLNEIEILFYLFFDE